ncbi:MAG: DUF2079 domain-containing protein [Acidimicrobiales bacterium]
MVDGVEVAGDPETPWLKRRDPARWVLGAMVVVWSAVFITLGWLRHARFGTFAFDLGIYDQGIWLLSRFEMFDTVKGLPLLGHHMNLALVLLAPFYRLGAGPEFLLVVQVVAQASGAVAVFLLARDRLADRALAVVLAAVLLLNPTYQFLTWEFFHPDALAIAPLLFAYWAARAERWRWFAFAAVLAVACKEDVAFAVAAMGVLIFFRGHKRIGAAVAALAAGWFLLATRVLMPAFLGGLRPFYDSYFGEFGRGFANVVGNVVVHPDRVADAATRDDRLTYYWKMSAPFGFLPLAGLPTMLIAAPMLAVNALTSFPYARDYRFHYSALVFAGLMLATIEGVAFVGRQPWVRRVLVGLVATSALATTIAWGPSPISVKFQSGIWPLESDPRDGARRAAVALLPEGAPVSATYYFVPHVAHRDKVYDFPEPWKAVNWGIAGENLHDPRGVRWILVDRLLFNRYERELVDRLLSTEFVARYDNLGILLAERVGPAP